MAAFFSNNTVGYWYSTSNYIYGTLTGDISRSGNTVTLSNLVLALSSRYTSTGTDNNWYFTINGVSNQLSISASGTNLGTHTLANVSLNVTESQTTSTISWSSSDGNSGNFTVSFPAPPRGLSLSNIVPGVDNFLATVSVTSWGSGGSSDSRYLRLSVCSEQSTTNRRYNSNTSGSLSAAISVTNGSSGNITIAPNTQYYITMSASNGAMSTGSSSYQTAATLPPQAAISVTAVTNTSATIAYACPVDGGRYAKTLEYSLDGGNTWLTGATVSGGSVATGTFVISGLASGTAYTLLSRVTTDAGSTNNETTVFTTTGGTPSIALLVSVANSSTRTNKLYGSLNQKTRLVEKLYASVDGKSKLVK